MVDSAISTDMASGVDSSEETPLDFRTLRRQHRFIMKFLLGNVELGNVDKKT